MQMMSDNAFLLIVIIACLTSPIADGEKVVIYHWNDLWGQLQQIRPWYNPSSGEIPQPCNNLVNGTLEDCVGGIENLLYKIQEDEVPIPLVDKTLRISTGNLVSGENGWVATAGWKTYGDLVRNYYGKVNKSQGEYFFHSYGLKEFEPGLVHTSEYHFGHNETALIANLECKGTVDELEFCEKATKSFEGFSSGGSNIGVIGFINPLAAKLSSPGSFVFHEIVPKLRTITEEATSYQSFIAIGDGSLDIAKKILDNVPKVKLVIFGSGLESTPDMSGPGAYPIKYWGGSIATAGRYGTSVGRLVIDVNETGIIGVDVENSKLLRPVRRDGHIEVKEVAGIVTKITNEDGSHPKGKSVFALEGGESCWRRECGLGKLVADAMVHCVYQGSNLTINAPVVGILHGGALCNKSVLPNELITKTVVHQWLPHFNRIFLADILGSDLQKLFELSGTGIKPMEENDLGQFLQVSDGLELYYTVDSESNDTNSTKIEKIRIVEETETHTLVMKDLNPSMSYRVVLPSFILEGRSVYGEMRNAWKNVQDLGELEATCVHNYITALQNITAPAEERIHINPASLPPAITDPQGGNAVWLPVLLTVAIMSVLVVIVGFAAYNVGSGRNPLRCSRVRQDEKTLFE